MIFVINNKKYDTEKMEKISNVEKWYPINNYFLEKLTGKDNLGRDFSCSLFKSKKGNYLLVHETNGVHYGESITEFEVKALLKRYDIKKYEEMFGELEEA